MCKQKQVVESVVIQAQGDAALLCIVDSISRHFMTSAACKQTRFWDHGMGFDPSHATEPGVCMKAKATVRVAWSYRAFHNFAPKHLVGIDKVL